MKKLVRVFILITLLTANNSVAAVSNTCISSIRSHQADEVHFFNVNSQISTPESLPQVKRAVQKLKEIVEQSQKLNDEKSKIYRSSLDLVNKTLQLGEKIIQNKAESQYEVFDFFYQFTKIIDLPKDYADQIGHYADGFSYLKSFNEKDFFERLEAFNLRFTNPEPLLKELNETLQNPKKRNFTLTSSFKYISVTGADPLPDSLSFTFQYRYIFRKGLLSFSDLFKERESGKFFLGVSFKDFSPYDGQHGDSNAFLRHDYLHSYIQKYNDQLLFDEFGASTLMSRTKLKKITNQKLNERFNEYTQIKDSQFKDAVEIVMFALLHEIGLTYPVGAHRYLENNEKRQLFKDLLMTTLKSKFYGKKLAKLNQDTVLEAINWIQIRATEDAKFVRENYK